MNIVHLRPKQRSKYRIMLGSGITLQRGTFSGWQMENICKKVPTRKATLYSNSAPNDITS